MIDGFFARLWQRKAHRGRERDDWMSPWIRDDRDDVDVTRCFVVIGVRASRA